MTSPFRRYAAALALLLLSLPPAVAAAEGNGLKVGEGRLHPYFELENRFDSAAGLAPAGAGFTLQPDMVLHFRPGARLDLPSPNLSVAASANLDALLYTGIMVAATRNLSRVDGNVNLDLGVNRSGAFGVDLSDNLVRSDRSQNVALGVGVLSFFNDARLGLGIRPGGGALIVEPSYHFVSELFSSQTWTGIPCGGGLCDPQSVSNLNYFTHRFGIDTRWKFLPKTGLLLDGEYDIRQYPGGGGNVPLQYFKVSTGLAGLVTPHVAVTAKLGWAQDLSQKSFASLVAHGELAYLLSDTAQLRLGYMRNFEPVSSSLVSFGDDRGYIEGRTLLGGRFSLHGGVLYDFIRYAVGGRADNVIGANLGGDYEIRPWVSLGLGYQLTNRQSSTGEPGMNFTRNEGFAKVNFIY